MQCLTDLIFLSVVVESIFINSQSALRRHHFRQWFESHHPAVKFIPPGQIPNILEPLYTKVWYLPKLNFSWFDIWATWHRKSLSMCDWLQWLNARSGQLVGIILDIRQRGDSIYTAELQLPAALASYVSFVFKIFAIHQNMGPVQCGNTCLQKLTSQSWTN